MIDYTVELLLYTYLSGNSTVKNNLENEVNKKDKKLQYHHGI